MIALTVVEGRKVFRGVESGSEAYVDADWLAGRTEGNVPAFVAQGRSLVCSWDGASFDYAASTAEAAVAGAFWLVAEAAALRAGSVDRAAVAGSGLTAGLARHLLGGAASAEDDRVDLIIEPRGDAASLAESTSRVRDLGTVLLAGLADSAFPFDLYPDVHVRGLRLVALPLPLDLQSAGSEQVLRIMNAPATVRVDQPIPEGASWYRVTAD